MLLVAWSPAQAEEAPEASTYGGSLWSRSTLSGSWGGVRDRWAAKGITFGLDATYTLQGVAGGGFDGPVFERVSDEDDVGNVLSGMVDVAFDTGKAGLWEGGTFNARVDGRVGRSILQRAGSVSAVDNDALFPNVVDRFDEPSLALTALTFTQALGAGFSAFGGLMNTAEGDANELAGSALANDFFLNSALLYSLVEDATVPNVTLGGGVGWEPHERVAGSFSVFGTVRDGGREPVPTARDHVRDRVDRQPPSLDRPGAETFGALYGIDTRRTDIAADPRTVLGRRARGPARPDHARRHVGALLQRAPVPSGRYRRRLRALRTGRTLGRQPQRREVERGRRDRRHRIASAPAARSLGPRRVRPRHERRRSPPGSRRRHRDRRRGLLQRRADAVAARHARRAGDRLRPAPSRYGVGARDADARRPLTGTDAAPSSNATSIPPIAWARSSSVSSWRSASPARCGSDTRAADNRALFIGIFGCNLAWAIVDGVMYVLTALFDRGRKVRLFREVARTPSDEAALRRIGDELDGPLLELTTPEERGQLHRWILTILRRERPDPPQLRRADVLGGVAVTLVIVLATVPDRRALSRRGEPERRGAAVPSDRAHAAVPARRVVGRVVGGQPLRIASGSDAARHDARPHHDRARRIAQAS